MSKLVFSDGMEIETSGPLRVIRKSDGCYVVGNGLCCPVDGAKEGEKLIAELKHNHQETDSNAETQEEN